MAFQFAPKGWALCNGQLLPINQNQALFALLGTNFGGNGQTNFALPNFQGRVPIHVGGGHTLGERGGEQAHTVSIPELPEHGHVLHGSNTVGAEATPSDSVPARSRNPIYGPAHNLVAARDDAVSNVGGSQAHPNMQPFLTLNFCIALQGIFPSWN